MKCNNCGTNIENNKNFCPNCGIKIEQTIQQNQENSVQNGVVSENNNLQTQNASKEKKNTLSWISLGFLVMQLFCFICQFSGLLYKYVYSKLLFIFEFPYIIVSLILAIISRAKNKDKMSLVLIIVDITVIFILIIFIVLAVILFASLINACLTPNSSVNSSINEIFDGCREMG